MTNPYAGTTDLPEGAGQRSEMPRRSSQMQPGGLFAPGTRVEVIYDGAERRVSYEGDVAEFGSVPAPHLVLHDAGYADGRLVVFLGPGVTIRPALPRHPAL